MAPGASENFAAAAKAVVSLSSTPLTRCAKLLVKLAEAEGPQKAAAQWEAILPTENLDADASFLARIYVAHEAMLASPDLRPALLNLMPSVYTRAVGCSTDARKRLADLADKWLNRHFISADDVATLKANVKSSGGAVSRSSSRSGSSGRSKTAIYSSSGHYQSSSVAVSVLVSNLDTVSGVAEFVTSCAPLIDPPVEDFATQAEEASSNPSFRLSTDDVMALNDLEARQTNLELAHGTGTMMAERLAAASITLSGIISGIKRRLAILEDYALQADAVKGSVPRNAAHSAVLALCTDFLLRPNTALVAAILHGAGIVRPPNASEGHKGDVKGVKKDLDVKTAQSALTADEDVLTAIPSPFEDLLEAYATRSDVCWLTADQAKQQLPASAAPTMSGISDVALALPEVTGDDMFG